MRQIPKGASSVVYEDGDVIIKQALPEAGRHYIERQAGGYDIVAELRESGQDIEVNLPALICIDEREIREKRINGVHLDSEIYDPLPRQQKDALAKQTASFLHALHQLRPSEKPKQSIRHIFDSLKNAPHTAKEVIDIFDYKLPDETARAIFDAEKYLRSTPISDEMHVMTHKDLRDQNMLYDEKEKKLGIIDFEMAGVDNVYWDFVPQAPGSIPSWDFIKRTVGFYNAVPDNPIKIDIEKVRNTLVYGTAHEIARVLKDEKERGKVTDLDVKNRAEMLTTKLEPILADAPPSPERPLKMGARMAHRLER
ncbi:MAG: aminoglycoside phosphotransferase family protein [Alphaproteobacteria bacterium]|nr:aminoglycoside phosphotransferase family protein [Alphaproteobacteria bacterium]